MTAVGRKQPPLALTVFVAGIVPPNYCLDGFQINSLSGIPSR
jgi:hypothetical protein